MKIIPELYIENNQCVSYYKKDPEQKSIYASSPLNLLKSFEQAGAKEVLITELSENRPTDIHRFTNKTGLHLWYSDGLHDMETVEKLFDAGVSALALNQNTPSEVQTQALSKFGAEKIFFTIESERDTIQSRPNIIPADVAAEAIERGFKTLIFRDTKTLGTFHPNFDEVERILLAAAGKIKLYVAGGMGKISDLEILQGLGVAGVIISRAFLERKLSLRECLTRFGVEE